MQQDKIIGIDFLEDHIVISYAHQGLREPFTVSMINGSQIYQIPFRIGKHKEKEEWIYAHEVIEKENHQNYLCFEQLFDRALKEESLQIEEKVYEYTSLLLQFMKKMFRLTYGLSSFSQPDKLVVTVKKITPNHMNLFWKLFLELGFSLEQLIFLEYEESFYYYALSQKRELTLSDICLFDYDDQVMSMFLLHQEKSFPPSKITINESKKIIKKSHKDEEFLAYLSFLDKENISTVYLTGNGFDGDWLDHSLVELCKGRRVFVGKNLFSKGCCFAGRAKTIPQNWHYSLSGKNKIRTSLGINIQNGQQAEHFTVVKAGSNWYESKSECEVILQKHPKISIWIGDDEQQDKKVLALELNGFPSRKERMSRVRITFSPKSSDKIEVLVQDLGFGEFEKSSEKTWEYLIDLI